LVINKCVTAVKVSNFSGHYLRNRSTLDIGVLGYIGIVQHKEQSPEVLSIPPGTPCIGRTAPLTSRRCILYIYSTNIRTEYFEKCCIISVFPLQNVCYFIILPCLFPVLFAFYIQGVLKFKCKIPAPKGLHSGPCSPH